MKQNWFAGGADLVEVVALLVAVAAHVDLF